ncbi:sugar phosphate isomerase/epimerase [Candidatus Thorarchaeota archaeon]|nr:MAG: sugar phosphate isomerase/epimerase [Candidatus Thorarchaeota archaeon]
MQIGTYARTNDQVLKGLESSPDFIELRMDMNHQLTFNEAKLAMNKAGIPCTLHLPSDQNWKPIELSENIIPYIDLAQMIDAELVTLHSSLSSLLYTDEEIDAFLQAFPLAFDAAKESGVQLAIETLGLYYTEMMLIFDEFPDLKIDLDIGHGQLLATNNRALGHIENYCQHIEMVNVHDNNACEAFAEILATKAMSEFSREDLREISISCDTHLPIGDGSIEFLPIFSALKERNYDSRFLMLSSDPLSFNNERDKFMDLWLKA